MKEYFSQNKSRDLSVIFLIVGFFAILFSIWAAVSGNMLYRGQHFGAALTYAEEGIDLLRPQIPGFNAYGSGTPQEFPIWQAMAGPALQLTNSWWPATTIVSLLLFVPGVIALYRLGKR